MSLTRRQFEQACRDFIRKGHSANHHRDQYSHSQAWLWNEHPTFPGLGYMSRSSRVPTCSDTDRQLKDAQEVEDSSAHLPDSTDAAVASTPTVNHITAKLYVVYSATFQVPALYFSVHHDNGMPLSLEEICRSPLFLPQPLPSEQVASFALRDPGSSFALLSQGDHPTLGTPCWYIHPCRTSEVVGEIMAEMENAEWTEEERALRWIEAWFMVLGNVICLDSMSEYV